MKSWRFSLLTLASLSLVLFVPTSSWSTPSDDSARGKPLLKEARSKTTFTGTKTATTETTREDAKSSSKNKVKSNFKLPVEAPLTVTGETWKRNQLGVLPMLMCAPEGFFRTCYSNNELSCVRAAQEATKACISQIRAPASIRPHYEGRGLGFAVGSCVGRKLEHSLRQYKMTASRCDSVERWAK